jgi:small subunit ribosomal protein S14
MTNFIERDKTKRASYLRTLDRRTKIKTLLSDPKLPLKVRYKLQIKLTKLTKSSSRIRLKNRCFETGRGHSVLKSFQLSRIKVRELGSMGSLNGLSKSSW